MTAEEQRARLVARFLSYVKTGKDYECWEWVGPRLNREDGHMPYGRFALDGGEVKAHRFMYELMHGPIPEGLVIRHACDNPPCVNPAHLQIGTVADNTYDKFARGRGADRRGQKHPLARITDADVIEIRKSASCGVRQHALAAKYGLSRQHVGKIIRRESWRHI